eukprot:gene28878-35872_t
MLECFANTSAGFRIQAAGLVHVVGRSIMLDVVLGEEVVADLQIWRIYEVLGADLSTAFSADGQNKTVELLASLEALGDPHLTMLEMTTLEGTPIASDQSAVYPTTVPSCQEYLDRISDVEYAPYIETCMSMVNDTYSNAYLVRIKNSDLKFISVQLHLWLTDHAWGGTLRVVYTLIATCPKGFSDPRVCAVSEDDCVRAPGTVFFPNEKRCLDPCGPGSEPGYVSDSPAECIPCDAGHISAGNSDPCRPCPVGYTATLP